MLTELIKFSEISFIPDQLQHEFSSGLQLCGFLEACKKVDDGNKVATDRFVYLDQDKMQRWSLVELEKC